MFLLAAVMAAESPVSLRNPAGPTLSPWLVLPVDDSREKAGAVQLDGHQSFNQRAIPAQTIRTTEAVSVEGTLLDPDTQLALTVNILNNAETWCVLPAPGGTELTHRSQWGKRETRCFADTDGDFRLDTVYFGKLDLLGLPSVRKLTNPVPLAAPIGFKPADPHSVEGFNIKGTVIYFDMNKNRSSPCVNPVPFHMRKAGGKVAERRLALSITRDDGTVCYRPGSEILLSKDGAYLPGKAGQTLEFAGSTLRIDDITGGIVRFTVLSGFTPYVVSARTQADLMDD